MADGCDSKSIASHLDTVRVLENHIKAQKKKDKEKGVEKRRLYRHICTLEENVESVLKKQVPQSQRSRI